MACVVIYDCPFTTKVMAGVGRQKLIHPHKMDLQEESIVSVKCGGRLINNFSICTVEMDVVEIGARA